MPKFLSIFACVLLLGGCAAYSEKEDENAKWWQAFYGTDEGEEDYMCSFYGNCQSSQASMCSFYGNCPGKEKSWYSGPSSSQKPQGANDWNGSSPGGAINDF